MKRLVLISVLALSLVYAVYSSAHAAPGNTNSSAPVAVMKAPKMPEPAAEAPAAPAMVPEMAPVAPGMAPAAMEAPKPAMEAPAAMKASEKPAVAPAKAKESGLDKATKWITLIVTMMGGLLTIIGAILAAIKGQEWRQKLKSGRWAKILGYARQYAFPAVEMIAKATPWTGDDKLAEFLKRMDDWLEGEGDAPLSANEVKNLKREAADLAAVTKVENNGGKPSSKVKVDEKAVSRVKKS